ncbi:MAG: hypothetical protein MHM6MM_000554 [Cercozoa sp. M6MM]
MVQNQEEHEVVALMTRVFKQLAVDASIDFEWLRACKVSLSDIDPDAAEKIRLAGKNLQVSRGRFDRLYRVLDCLLYAFDGHIRLRVQSPLYPVPVAACLFPFLVLPPSFDDRDGEGTRHTARQLSLVSEFPVFLYQAVGQMTRVQQAALIRLDNKRWLPRLSLMSSARSVTALDGWLTCVAASPGDITVSILQRPNEFERDLYAHLFARLREAAADESDAFHGAVSRFELPSLHEIAKCACSDDIDRIGSVLNEIYEFKDSLRQKLRPPTGVNDTSGFELLHFHIFRNSAWKKSFRPVAWGLVARHVAFLYELQPDWLLQKILQSADTLRTDKRSFSGRIFALFALYSAIPTKELRERLLKSEMSFYLPSGETTTLSCDLLLRPLVAELDDLRAARNDSVFSEHEGVYDDIQQAVLEFTDEIAMFLQVWSRRTELSLVPTLYGLV